MPTAATLIEPIRKVVNKTQVALVRDDLTALEVDAFVAYARENLELGSGFGTAIQTRGGDAVKKELEKIGGVRMGEAVITAAGRLHARHIIHACGPKFQEPDAERKLRDCVTASLRLAGERGLESVAFPPLGTGFYGIPLNLCARVMLATVRDYLREETSLREVIICAIDRREFEAFKPELEKL